MTQQGTCSSEDASVFWGDMKTIDMTICEKRQETRWLVRMLDGKWLTESMTPGLVAASMDDSADEAIDYACCAHDRHVSRQEGEAL